MPFAKVEHAPAGTTFLPARTCFSVARTTYPPARTTFLRGGTDFPCHGTCNPPAEPVFFWREPRSARREPLIRPREPVFHCREPRFSGSQVGRRRRQPRPRGIGPRIAPPPPAKNSTGQRIASLQPRHHGPRRSATRGAGAGAIVRLINNRRPTSPKETSAWISIHLLQCLRQRFGFRQLRVRVPPQIAPHPIQSPNLTARYPSRLRDWSLAEV